MATTQAIQKIKDILRIEQLPWQWWGALLNNQDRGLLLVISDWLEEQGDLLHATAWRAVHKNRYEPVRESAYDYWWFRKNMPAGSYPVKFAYHPNYQQSLLPDDLFYTLCCIEPIGTIRKPLAVAPYVCMTSGTGRASAFHKIAHATALLLAGFTPTVSYV